MESIKMENCTFAAAPKPAPREPSSTGTSWLYRWFAILFLSYERHPDVKAAEEWFKTAPPLPDDGESYEFIMEYATKRVEEFEAAAYKLDDKCNALLRVSGGIGFVAAVSIGALAENSKFEPTGWLLTALGCMALCAVFCLIALFPVSTPSTTDLRQLVGALNEVGVKSVKRFQYRTYECTIQSWSIVLRKKSRWMKLANAALVASVVLLVISVVFP